MLAKYRLGPGEVRLAFTTRPDGSTATFTPTRTLPVMVLRDRCETLGITFSATAPGIAPEPEERVALVGTE